MIDLKIPFLSDTEFDVIKQLALILEPVKLTVEALCQRDMNLYKADIAMQFMMKENYIATFVIRKSFNKRPYSTYTRTQNKFFRDT